MLYLKKLFISRTLKNHFGYLFDQGYKIRYIEYSPEAFGNWVAILESIDCLIIVTDDRDEIFLSFASIMGNIKEQVGIQPMIYYISKGQTFIGNFEKDIMRDKNKQFQRLAYLWKNIIAKYYRFWEPNLKNT